MLNKCKRCNKAVMVETYIIGSDIFCAPCYYKLACIFCSPVNYKEDCKGHDIVSERGNRFSKDRTFTKNMIFDAEK